MSAQVDSIARIAKHFLTREQDSMNTYAQELQDERHEAMQKFNDSNDFFLDAQPADRDPEGVTVYSEAEDAPRLVSEFADVADFRQFVSLIGRMSEHLVTPVVESLIEEQRDIAQRQAVMSYLAPIFTVAEGDDRSNAKSLRFIDTITEKSAA